MRKGVDACCLVLLLLLGSGVSPARALSDLVLPSGSSATTLNVPGDLVLHVPSGILEATALDLRAGNALEVEPLTIVATTISFCTLRLGWAGCVPFGDGTFGTTANPFRVTVLGPLTGALELYAAVACSLPTSPLRSRSPPLHCYSPSGSRGWG